MLSLYALPLLLVLADASLPSPEPSATEVVRSEEQKAGGSRTDAREEPGTQQLGKGAVNADVVRSESVSPEHHRADGDQAGGDDAQRTTPWHGPAWWFLQVVSTLGAVFAGVSLLLVRRSLRATEKAANAAEVGAAVATDQADILRATLEATKVAADSARKSADVAERALLHGDRPLIVCRHPRDSPLPVVGRPTCVRVQLENVGRGAAVIDCIEVRLHSFAGVALPQVLHYTDDSNAASPASGLNIVLPPSDTHFCYEYLEGQAPMTEDDVRLRRRETRYLLYGRVRYADLLGATHETRFCWLYLDAVDAAAEWQAIGVEPYGGYS